MKDRRIIAFCISAALLHILGSLSASPAGAQQLEKPDTIQAFPVGADPLYLAFDGAHIWVTNSYDGTVMKLRASDGAPQGTYPVGTYPNYITFDGTNIWVGNFDSDNVTKLLASDGTVLGTFDVDAPKGL